MRQRPPFLPKNGHRQRAPQKGAGKGEYGIGIIHKSGPAPKRATSDRLPVSSCGQNSQKSRKITGIPAQPPPELPIVIHSKKYFLRHLPNLCGFLRVLSRG